MQNFQQPGDTMTFTAPTAGVVSGSFYLIGALLVCATVTVDETLPFAGKTSGVFTSAPKTTSQAWVEGTLLYWDDSGKKFTTTSAGNRLVGCAAEAAGSSDTTGTVRLNGTATAAS